MHITGLAGRGCESSLNAATPTSTLESVASSKAYIRAKGSVPDPAADGRGIADLHILLNAAEPALNRLVFAGSTCLITDRRQTPASARAAGRYSTNFDLQPATPVLIHSLSQASQCQANMPLNQLVTAAVISENSEHQQGQHLNTASEMDEASSESTAEQGFLRSHSRTYGLTSYLPPSHVFSTAISQDTAPLIKCCNAKATNSRFDATKRHPMIRHRHGDIGKQHTQF